MPASIRRVGDIAANASPRGTVPRCDRPANDNRLMPHRTPRFGTWFPRRPNGTGSCRFGC